MDTANKKNIDLLDLFMRGNTSLEDEQLLFEWFRTKEARKEIFSYYEKQWESASQELTPDTQMRMFDKLYNQMGDKKTAEDKSHTQKKYALFSRITRYIAAACLLLLVGVTSYYIARKNTYSSKEFIVSVDKGQKASLTLPDGTLVWLNSASMIKYDNSYNNNDRRIILEGEAYFEVAKDKNKKFTVTVDNIDVEALGTSFNVKSYLSEENITVTLVEGKVRVGNENSKTCLKPNERVVYNRRAGSFNKENTYDVSNIAAWRNNELAFYGETLEDIGATLSRIYNIDIVFTSEPAKHYSFSGVIRNNSLSNVLEIISMTAPIKYKIYNDTIEISANQ